jgi:hypothetical protein
MNSGEVMCFKELRLSPTNYQIDFMQLYTNSLDITGVGKIYDNNALESEVY